MKTWLWKFVRGCLPPAARQRIRNTWLARRTYDHLFARDTRFHDEFYTAEYYEHFAPTSESAVAEHFVAQFLARLHPADVIDVGCGTGEYLAEFGRRGVPARGFELAAAALEMCRQRGLNVERWDLTSAEAMPAQADAVYSIEVAEHLLPRFAAPFVQTLAGAARRDVVITAAAPGQEGVNHFNCQPKAYWIELFSRAGFAYDGPLTEDWQAASKHLTAFPWFSQNLMVFHRK